MVRGGFSLKNPNEPGDFAMKISNARLCQLTVTSPLRDYIKQQQLLYAAHVSRMRNDAWQKMTLFMASETGGGRSRIRQYCEDTVGIPDNQLLRPMQNKKEFRQEVGPRYGRVKTASAKNRKRGAAKQ